MKVKLTVSLSSPITRAKNCPDYKGGFDMYGYCREE